MSKKGRTSVLLLGSLIVCLICIPLAYLAYGAKLDRAALNRRMALLEATQIISPTALQVRYHAARERLLPILPPDPTLNLNPSGGIVVFDPKDFGAWVERLEPADLDGVTVYPVTVTEDPDSRNTVFYNGLAQPIASITPEQDYFPFAWLVERHPEYYAETANLDVQAWFEAVYDPARVSVTYYLLPVRDVRAMAEAQLAADSEQSSLMRMMMGEGLPEPVTNIVIFAIERTTNGTALGIGWPEGFTNKLEVFARSSIATTGWFVASSNLSTAGTNSLWWLDSGLSTSVLARFYSVGNADLDSDGDGLADARERKISGTDENEVDTDGDGLVDGYSGRVTTNSYLGGAHTNGGVYVEGEMTWGTDLLKADTDGDGMADGWEVVNGHNPMDPNDPPNVCGTISYAGGQTGTVWVVAVTSSNSWSTNQSIRLSIPGAYLVSNLPASNYWIKAWRDSDGDGAVDALEARGSASGNAILVTNRVSGQNITLTDPDNDNDGLPDWWEIARFGSTTNWNGSADPDGDQYTNLEEYEAGTDPLNSLSHPWNISGTITYSGPQTGPIYILACGTPNNWAADQLATMSSNGTYTITHLPPDKDYWIRAWRDSNDNAVPDFGEAWGDSPENPVSLTTNVAAVDVTLEDNDFDSDGLPDWWEVLYGYDPYNGGGVNAAAWWKLNATVGTNVQDSTSHSNHGVLLNAGTNSWTTGVISNALVFDGTNDYVQIPDSPSLKPNYISVSLWLKPSREYSDGSTTFFSKKEAGSSTGYRLSYEQGNLSFLIGVSGDRELTFPCNFGPGTWCHVVGTYGGSRQSLYVDGILVAQTNYNWGTGFGYIDHSTIPARIGASAGTTASNYFDGAFDDVQIYSSELTSNQVLGIYQTGSDEDGDKLTLWQEYQAGTSPTSFDTDNDGLVDNEEVMLHTDPLKWDTDGDGLSDGEEITGWRWGRDWIGIWEWAYPDPLVPDSDNDGLDDFWEKEWRSNPCDPDTDGDGLDDGQEVSIGTDPVSLDTDWDWLRDDEEVNIYKTDPLLRDTDGDGLYDWDELFTHSTDPLIADVDEDGLNDSEEINNSTNPRIADTDSDGLNDGEEVKVHFTNPLLADPDGDLLNDRAEIRLGTDPFDPDMDNDGLLDGSEVYGYEAWSVTTITTNMAWTSPGTNAHWVTQWTTGVVSYGFIKGGISDFVNLPIQFGSNMHERIRISSDGVILLGSNNSSKALSYGVNLPMSWPGISNLLAVCWDEYSISASTGVWYEATGTGAASRVTVTWNGAKVTGFTSTAEGLDFQMTYAASNRSIAMRYKTSSGLQFPQQALFSIGARGDSTNRFCRIVFNRLNVLEPGTTITISPAISCPTNTDTDGDSFLDGFEADKGWNPVVQEDWFSDIDGDGLDFNTEVYGYQTDPFEVDTDGDGFTDKYEADMGLDPLWPYDYPWDGDYLYLEQEYSFGTNPWSGDTDGDQIYDDVEISQGSDPCDGFDGGVAPEGVFEFRPRLSTDSPLGLAGTVFVIDNYRLTPYMFWDNGYASLNLAKGREHILGIATRQGFVQCPSVYTDMAVGGQPSHEQVPGKDQWVCGNTVIDYPSKAFGFLGFAKPLAEGEEQNQQNLMRGIFRLDNAPAEDPNTTIRDRRIEILSPSGAAVQTKWWPGSEVHLVGKATPDCSGTWSWAFSKSCQNNANGSNVTLTINENIRVTGYFSYGVGTTPISTNVDLEVYNTNDYFLVNIELKVRHPVTGVYSNEYITDTPIEGSAVSLFSSWPSQHIEVSIHLFPEVDLPNGFIVWSSLGSSIPNNSLSHTFTWNKTDDHLKTITINFPLINVQKKVFIDVPNVRDYSEGEAGAYIAATFPAEMVGQLMILRNLATDFGKLYTGAKADAVRHCYWNAICVSYDIPAEAVEIAGLAHEHNALEHRRGAFETTMDIHNNRVGQTIYHPLRLIPYQGMADFEECKSDTLNKYDNGELLIWDGSGDFSDTHGILLNSKGELMYQ